MAQKYFNCIQRSSQVVPRWRWDVFWFCLLLPILEGCQMIWYLHSILRDKACFHLLRKVQNHTICPSQVYRSKIRRKKPTFTKDRHPIKVSLTAAQNKDRIQPLSDQTSCLNLTILCICLSTSRPINTYLISNWLWSFCYSLHGRDPGQERVRLGYGPKYFSSEYWPIYLIWKKMVSSL